MTSSSDPPGRHTPPGRGEPLPPPLSPLPGGSALPPPGGSALPPPSGQPASGRPPGTHQPGVGAQNNPAADPGRPAPSPQQVAQQAARPPAAQAPRATPQQKPAPAPAKEKVTRDSGGIGRFVWIFVILGLVVAAGIAAGSVLSGLDTVVVVEERGEAMPDWMPYAVAGGVVLAGLIALMLGGPRPELLASWAGLALITYGSGLGLERIDELATSDVAVEVLTQLDSTESLILGGAALVLLGQALAIRRFFRPRPIAAVRALLGTGFLSALAIAVALTSILHAGVSATG